MIDKHQIMRLAWYVLNVPREKADRKLAALPVEDASAIYILSSIYQNAHDNDQRPEDFDENRNKIGFTAQKDESNDTPED